MDVLPDLASLSDDDLRHQIDDLVREEEEVSYRRRLLHGRIDILRAELVDRIKRRHGGEDSQLAVDIDRLTEILAHKGPPPGLKDDETG
jgi:anti-sigma-K factor RsiG